MNSQPTYPEEGPSPPNRNPAGSGEGREGPDGGVKVPPGSLEISDRGAEAEDRTRNPGNGKKEGRNQPPKPRKRTVRKSIAQGFALLLAGGAITLVVALWIQGKVSVPVPNPPRQPSTGPAAPASPLLSREEAQAVAAELVTLTRSHESTGILASKISERVNRLKQGNQVELALPGLVKELQSPTIQERGQAAEILGFIGEPARSAIPDIAVLLTDPEGYPNEKAAWALWQLFQDPSVAEDPRAAATIHLLVRCIMFSGDAYNDGPYAMAALGELGPRSAVGVPTLIRVLGKPDPKSRAAAARTLGRIGHPAADPAVPVLQRMATEDNDGEVRGLAAEALKAFP